MKTLSKTILILLAAALLLPFIGMALAEATTDLSDQVEKRPTEQTMENLYNKGIGDSWVGGEPFSSESSDGSTSEAASGDAKGRTVGAAPATPDYRMIGCLNVTSGVIIASDGGSSLRLTPSAGDYPVYGYFEQDQMVGIFIDFRIQ